MTRECWGENGICMGAVDVGPLQYSCSRGVVVAGGERARQVCAVLDSGSGIYVIGEADLRRLRRHFPERSTGHPYEGGPTVTVADDRGQKIPQHTGVLTAHILTLWAPVVTRLSIPVLQEVKTL